MKKNQKKILALISIVFIVSVGVVLFFHFNLHIAPALQFEKMNFSDYYRRNHYLLGGTAKYYEIIINDFVSQDDNSRSSVYSFSCTINNNLVNVSLEYPGTPKHQYYRFPRLSHGEKYILITAQEVDAKCMITLGSGYYLFLLQEIDGIEYVYPCVYDTSMIPLSVISPTLAFQYADESLIYDSWYDADVCDYLKKYSHENPEFSYKLLAEDLKNNYHRLLYN